ncbi:MAG TPA: glucosyltransferase domain-containing protein [Arsenophonus nasoniae]|uniref:glucosyltransferase domain-containing protein n=1 Tax=Arsenophonus nasoniae TaxID=638 RepID=UPI00387A2461
MIYLNYITNQMNDKKFFYTCLFISFIYIFPLIISDIYYLDDLGRVIYGTMWNHDARYLSNIIYYILTFGNQTINISPYPQIFSIIVLSFSFLFITKIFKLEKNLISVFCCILILTSPFYIENLSYKFDSLTMSLSLFFCIYSVYFSSIYSNHKGYIIPILLLLCTLYTYEPSIGVFITLSIGLFLCDAFLNNKYNLSVKLLFKNVFIIITSLFLWKIISYLPGFYIRSTILSSSKIFEILIWKINIFIDTFDALFSYRYLISIILLIILSICCFLYYYVKFIYKNKIKDNIFITLFVLFSIPIIIIMSQGVSFFSLRKTDLFGFAPRVFIGYGVTTLVISIFIIKSKIHNSIKFTLFFLPFMYSLTLISTYSNASKSQLRILNLVSANLSQDIEKYKLKVIPMIVNGKMQNSNELNHSGKNNPILFNLVQTPLREQRSWGYRQLIALYNIPVIYPSENKIYIGKTELCKSKKISSNIFYDLFISQKNDLYIVDFNKKCS